MGSVAAALIETFTDLQENLDVSEIFRKKMFLHYSKWRFND